MNDDELNELIARSEQEGVIYREMDIKRERDAAELWRAQGNRGKPPQPLIQVEELPECYQTDEPFEPKELEETIEGRGQRRRNVVSYNDGLSDEAWAMVRLLSAHQLLLEFFYMELLFRPLKKEKTSRSCLSAPETRRSGARRINY